jgi:hypothetical protein
MIKLTGVNPTVFLKAFGGSLLRLVRVSVFNEGTPIAALLSVKAERWPETVSKVMLPNGESVLEAWAPDITDDCWTLFTLRTTYESASQGIKLRPQRKWIVHVVQTSHHDPGYTDLPSIVLRQHDRWLDEAIDMAQRTDSFPEDSKFRIVLEQAWSIDHFLKNTGQDRVNKAIDLMRAGRFELTALFGNMTTELCWHETLIRTIYHAFALKRKYGIPIVTAEHNDITGISWGLSQVLTDAGVKLFCPGIPLYYSWNQKGAMPSFWDERRIFGREGPGAFWWEAPDGKQVLFWCNNSGCGGSSLHTMPDLEATLQRIQTQGYPWDVIRWPVIGGARDNSPYIEGYSQAIMQWNQSWDYPHLVCSTNARFHRDLIRQDLSGLPVWRGELPGQDYPSGATSTAAATAANRNAHSILTIAETLSSAAAVHAGFPYPQVDLAEAYEETLWHDEHAWGFHFPCGPAMRASQHEKELHAYRAEALAHGVVDKAMARIADCLRIEEGYCLAVFNPTSWCCTAPVRVPLREMDNIGSEMQFVPLEKDSQSVGYLKGYVLGHRFHTVLPEAMIEGNFELLDAETGRSVPFQILEITSSMEPLPYSEDRLGIGSGTRRYGFYEKPAGLKRDLCFVAKDVPAVGYRAYRLVPKEAVVPTAAERHSVGRVVENEFYRIMAADDGTITSLFDKQANLELVDAEREHGFFGMLVRQGDSHQISTEECLSIEVDIGLVLSTLSITSRAFGHPVIHKTITLYNEVKRIYLGMKILKDPTPLLNAHVAFPFTAVDPRFRYEGSLSQMDPVRDYFPGSFMDAVAVQSWVKMTDESHSILWSSLDAPIAGLSRLWPGYVSPAHRCVLDASGIRSPQREVDLNKGWIYSQLFNNNFGTNFSVSQNGEALFRYVITSEAVDVSDAEATRFGWQVMEPLIPMLTDRCNPVNRKPTVGGFLRIENPAVALLDWKQAEDGGGSILRLWNISDRQQLTTVAFPCCTVTGSRSCTLCEEDGLALPHIDDRIEVSLAPRQVFTVRVQLTAE